ncbi:MAG TPA: glycosyltransferase family A protein, partial [Anaerovoracaceae bacterium]|nr:glycosyltransferase family A protein [Anaerovoracaceae bacterium]
MEHPKISILLPIRNEAPWLELRLVSILNQDFHDFELLIGDNASDDGSPDIYSTHARNDSRIKIFRHKTDIGAANNFKFLFDKAAGEYLVVAGGHDLWSGSYLTLLKDKLDSDNEIVLSFGKTVYI